MVSYNYDTVWSRVVRVSMRYCLDQLDLRERVLGIVLIAFIEMWRLPMNVDNNYFLSWALEEWREKEQRCMSVFILYLLSTVAVTLIDSISCLFNFPTMWTVTRNHESNKVFSGYFIAATGNGTKTASICMLFISACSGFLLSHTINLVQSQ